MVTLVLHLLVTLRDLLTWCPPGVLLLPQLLCLYLVKRRGLRLRPPLTSAPGDSLTPHRGFGALPCQERKELRGRGKQDSGRRRWSLAEFALQIALLSWTSVHASLQWSGPVVSQPRPSAGPPGPIGELLATSPHRAASPTDSLLSWNQKPTLQALASRSLTRWPEHHGHPRHGPQPGQNHSCSRRHRALCAHLARWRRRGRGGRSYSACSYEARRGSPTRYACSVFAPGSSRWWKCRNRRWSSGAFFCCQGPRSDLRGRYFLTHWRGGGRNGHRLQERHFEVNAKFLSSRGNHLQFRRRFSLCLPQHRLATPQDSRVGCPVSRNQGRFLHADRGRRRRTSAHRATAQKKSTRKGFSFRKWSKAKEGHNNLFGSRHERPQGCPADNIQAAHRDFSATERFGTENCRAQQDISPSSWPDLLSVSCQSSSFYLRPCQIPNASAKNPEQAEPWFVGFSRSGKTSRFGGIGVREAGRGSDVWPDFRFCPSKSSTGPKPGPDNVSGADSRSEQRPNVRAHRSVNGVRDSGCSNTSPPSSRAGSTQGKFLPKRYAEHVQTDGPDFQCRPDSGRDAAARDFRGQILGKIWRLRPHPRPWPAAVSGDDDLRFSHGRKHPSGDGRSCPFGSNVGTGKFGWRTNGTSNSIMFARGRTLEHFHAKTAGIDVEGEVLRTTSRSTLGHLCTGFPERNGGHCSEKGGDECRSKRVLRNYIRSICSDSQSKAKRSPEAKGKGERHRQGRGGRGISTAAYGMNGRRIQEAEGQETNPLSSQIDFCTWAFCLPRWLMRCCTKFSQHLWRFFTAEWRAQLASPTTAFPLLAPFPGCVNSRGLRFKCKGKLDVARKRWLHVIVFTLDFFYLGGFLTLSEPERRPNALQRKVYDRLWSLFAVCGDGSESFDAVPGRSGPELGAFLFQLEKFLENRPELNQSYVQHKPMTFSENPQLLPIAEFHELVPYKSLKASILKLVGTGAWPMAVFRSGPLWLPFQVPRFLLLGKPDDYQVWLSFKSDDKDDNLRLAALWDAKGFLKLAKEPLMRDHVSKVCNAFKNEAADRQVGDRRVPDSRELSFDGPFHSLPPGLRLTDLCTEPYREQLIGSVMDRRDFYHQARVSEERARSNMLYFFHDGVALKKFQAVKEVQMQKQAKVGWEKICDGFEEKSHDQQPQRKDGEWFPCFASLFHGNRLGAEFALKALEEVLQQVGLLRDNQRLKGRSTLSLGKKFEGLILDDYFAIGCEPVGTSSLYSFAARVLAKASEVYDRAGLEGSTERDAEAQKVFKAAGVEIISNDEAVAAGLTTLVALLAKRIALSTFSLRAARLGSIIQKLAARLAGSWTSVLLFRRGLASAADGISKLGSEAEKSMAQELSSWAALAPLAVSNIAVKYDPQVYAFDASLGLGAVVATKAEPEVVETLCLESEKRGSYTHLDCPNLALLEVAGEEVHEGFDFGPPEHSKRGLLLYFDFVELFESSGRVSACVKVRGFTVAPSFDLAASMHYNMIDSRWLEWCLHMTEEGRFRSFLSESPCTSLSLAAHPAVRSYAQPEGFNRLCPKTRFGKQLAGGSFGLLRHGRRFRWPRGKEQPKLSKIAWMAAWKAISKLGFAEAVIASCQFEPIHKKEFRFLLYMLRAQMLERRCFGGLDHVKIEGGLTKGSAVYTWPLTRHLADEFTRAMRRLKFLEEEDAINVSGHESVAVNDILHSSAWRTEKKWHWRRESHNNVSEVHAGLGVLAVAAADLPDSRFPGLLGLSAVQLQAVHFYLLSRWAVNWSHLVILLMTLQSSTKAKSPASPDPKPDWIFNISSAGPSLWKFLVALLDFELPSLDFVLPCVHISSPQPYLLWTFCIGLVTIFLASCGLMDLQGAFGCGCPKVKGAPGRLLWILISGFWVAEAMVPLPALERGRAETRSGNNLLATRFARHDTLERHEKLPTDFRVWLHDQHKVYFSLPLTTEPPDAEEICKWLINCGQEMYLSEEAHRKSAETINAVSAARLVVRKQLTGVWDLALAWLTDELSEHHPALPLSNLLAMLALALMRVWKGFSSLLSGFGPQTTKVNGRPPSDLGSLRPGGATHLLLTTKDLELVRRRGRWVTGIVMEIYLRKILYTTFAEKLDWTTRAKVIQLAGTFPKLLDLAFAFLNSAIPPQKWWRFFQASDNEEHGEEWGQLDEGANFWLNTAVGDGNPHMQWKSAGRRAWFQAGNWNFHPQAPPALTYPALMAMSWPGMKVPTFG